MKAQNEGNKPAGVRLVQVTAREAMALGLGEVAMAEVVTSLRSGGYHPTDEQFAALARAVVDGALAMPHLVADMSETTAEQLEEAARDLGALVVAQVLGPPPRAN